MEELEILDIKHYGIIAALVDKLKLVEKIDKRITIQPQKKRENSITCGVIVKALIINILSDPEHRLYLVANFFKSCAVDRLLGEGIRAESLNDDIISRVLDAISEYGIKRLFTEIGIEIITENKGLSKYIHLDTTSISVEGSYPGSFEVEEGVTFNLGRGFSKDHRPDLLQYLLSLVTMGPAKVPICIEVLPGNSSDKNSFINTIEYVQEFYRKMFAEEKFVFIADSALYSSTQLLPRKYSVTWITHIPSTITESMELLERKKDSFNWKTYDDNYSYESILSNYGGIEQRWLVVFSEEAFDRDTKSLETKIAKSETSLKAVIEKLGKETYKCEKDALKAIKKETKKFKLFKLKNEIKEVYGNKKDSKDNQKLNGYGVTITYLPNEEEISKEKNSCGKFILGTNDLDKLSTPDEDILVEYKKQSNVEDCFKLIKNNTFHASDIYVKKPNRVASLTFVISLAVMVYNIAQYHARKSLEKNQDTFPNQLNKGVQNPTMKWIAYCFSIIKITAFSGILGISKMQDHLKKMVSYFGETAMNIYGITGPAPPFELELS